jgi:hypothetical protein
MNITTPIDAYYGIFNLPAFSSENTTESLTAALTNVFEEVLQDYSSEEFFTLITPPTEYPDFWTRWKDNNGPLGGGGDVSLGSRLLKSKHLTQDPTVVAKALKRAAEPEGLDLYLVGPGGKSRRKVTPRGGESVTSSVWKDVLVHAGKLL